MCPPLGNESNGSKPRDSNGWDGKLRTEKKAVLANAEALSDSEFSDENAPPVEQIEADEGRFGKVTVMPY
jgi:protein phosphatase 1 regulatory subunit 7